MPEGHPERPGRINCLLGSGEIFTREGVIRLESSRQASREDLLRVHRSGYLDRVVATAGRDHVMLDPDTHTSKLSWETALYAAGGLLDVIDAVMEGSVQTGFAMVRPPGHHAETDRAMGFCLLNNVAIGARYLLEKHGIQRVLIVDWDVHHGNGTQRSFYDTNSVLFISTHQSPCYPGTGPAEETGHGEGTGFNVNIPLPAGCGDPEYQMVFGRVLRPIAAGFKPQFVLISAGFDAHRDDPLASMDMTESGYANLTSTLWDIAGDSANGRMVAVLEGGYNLRALAGSVDAVVTTLGNGGAVPPGFATTEQHHGTGDGLLDRIVGIQSQYWDL